MRDWNEKMGRYVSWALQIHRPYSSGKNLVAADIVNLHCLNSEGMTAGDYNSIFDPSPEAQHKCQFKGTTPARKTLFCICCYVAIKCNCYSLQMKI